MALKESTGKPDLTLIPIDIIKHFPPANQKEQFAISLIHALHEFYGRAFDDLSPIRAIVIEEYRKRGDLAHILTEVTKVMEFGASKYARENWMLGGSFVKLISATERHILAWSVDEIDKESGFNHLAHVLCNLGFLSYYQSRGELFTKNIDDRSTIYIHTQ